MKTKPTAAVTIVALLAGIVLVACDLHYEKVPGDAKPNGFKQVASWDACGANGRYCAEVIVFGSNQISFNDAIQSIETRYRKPGWNVNVSPDDERSDGRLTVSNTDKTTCFSLSHFNILAYRHYPGSPHSPDNMTMAKLVEPYSTVVQAIAGCG